MTRIRKAKREADAKRAAEAAAASRLFCRLNQSSWDVLSSPPPSPLRNAVAGVPETPLPLPPSPSPPPPPPQPPFPFPQIDSSSGRKRYFAKRTATNAVKADKSGIKMKKKKKSVANSDGDGAIVKFKEGEEVGGFKEADEVVLCPKLDRKGWQCGSVVKKGNLFCDKHLPASSSGTRSSSRKSVMPPTYSIYYTGFMGKKRG